MPPKQPRQPRQIKLIGPSRTPLDPAIKAGLIAGLTGPAGVAYDYLNKNPVPPLVKAGLIAGLAGPAGVAYSYLNKKSDSQAPRFTGRATHKMPDGNMMPNTAMSPPLPPGATPTPQAPGPPPGSGTKAPRLPAGSGTKAPRLPAGSGTSSLNPFTTATQAGKRKTSRRPPPGSGSDSYTKIPNVRI